MDSLQLESVFGGEGIQGNIQVWEGHLHGFFLAPVDELVVSSTSMLVSNVSTSVLRGA